MISAPKIFNNVFASLTSRQRDVVLGRFGLDKNKKRETLAALGTKYGVTRERIRQIEVSALGALRREMSAHAEFGDLIERIKRFLKEKGGVSKKEEFLNYLGDFVDGLTENHIFLLIETTKAFNVYTEDRHFHDFYYLDKTALKSAMNFVNQWAAFLNSKKEHVLKGEYEGFLKSYLRKKGVNEAQAHNYLTISKRIHKNPFGDKGLTDWPEIKPRTIRDRAYLILKKKSRPLHFRSITGIINEVGFDARKASAPTVHNELIKDGRFVLVGRGIYALSEHGYEPGTAREVISRVLKKHGAMKPREIILAIQKERFFKPNTILVNLQNKSYFERLPSGEYQIREA